MEYSLIMFNIFGIYTMWRVFMDEPEYKVHFAGGSTCLGEVIKVTIIQDYDIKDDWEVEIQYQGSLSDCEAWIRLKEGGYLL